ncbi:MAG: glutamate--tRNA ligase [Firmicutes bacterium]|nr:glutamate--tRNA ligase [Bacillota bacterium]
MQRVRVRFAPSPTGYLHVGGARTALFNWLFARHYGGDFILRIEDTDLVRSTEESVQAIFDGLTWLGLDWDEGPGKDGDHGPYYQTERLEIYRRYAQELIDKGRAYYCYCSPEELDQRRKELLAAGQAPRYDRKCLGLSAAEVERYKAEGRVPVIRFKAAEVGRTIVDDLVRGKVVFENEVVDDFVIVKSDGMPTYNFAVVVDDHLMEISHVIRGEDHLSNTPKQIQLYEALGWEVPQFAHISMILGPDKTKLSKRHGATSVIQYKDDGYLPEALLNYLALLGWSYNATDNLFTKEQLIEYFTLDGVSKNPAVFDYAKLQWMNGVYIRQTSVERLTDLCRPFLEQAGLITRDLSPAELARLTKIVAEMQTRLKTLNEIADLTSYFFTDVEYDEQALKNLRSELAPQVLERLAADLEGMPEFTQAALEAEFAKLMEEFDVKLGKLIHPVRAAVTGRAVSPGIYETLLLIGRDEVLKRLRAGAAKAKELLAE